MKKALFGLLALCASFAYADSTTPRIGLTIPTIGSPSWGQKINNNFQIIDSTINLGGVGGNGVSVYPATATIIAASGITSTGTATFSQIGVSSANSNSILVFSTTTQHWEAHAAITDAAQLGSTQTFTGSNTFQQSSTFTGTAWFKVFNASVPAVTWNDGYTQKFSNFVYNVKDYGATGDASTDDTAAINQAINSATSSMSVVYFPPGIYVCKSSIVAKSSVTLMGSGRYTTTLELPQQNINPMNYCLIRSTTPGLTNFEVRSMSLIGNRGFQTTSFSNSSTDGYAIFLSSGANTNIYFDDLFVSSFGAIGAAKNTGGGGILIVPVGVDSTVNNVRCFNVIFGNNDKVPGIYIDPENGSSRGGAQDIFVNQCSFAGGGNNNCVYVLGGYGTLKSQKAVNVHIDDNHFAPTESYDTSIELNGTVNFTINNNKFYFTGTALGNVALIRSDCANGSISHNQVYSSSTDTTKPNIGLLNFSDGQYQDNISIDHNDFFISTEVVGVLKILNGSRRIQVDHNNFLSTGTAINWGISVGYASQVNIDNNYFENVWSPIVISSGINPPTSIITITNNLFDGCGSSGTAHIGTTGGQIGATYVIVDGNKAISPGSTAGGAIFASLNVSASQNTGNVLRNNIVYGGLPATDAYTEWSLVWNNVGFDQQQNSAITRSGFQVEVANTALSIATVTVTAGDYYISGAVGHRTVGTTTAMYAGINTTANTLPTGDFEANFSNGVGLIAQEGLSIASSKDYNIPIPGSRFTATTGTKIYLVGQSDQANHVYGYLNAIPIGAH